jgi:hypothetical protein
MPTDIVYGRDVDARIGLMADASTNPTTWNYLEFVSLAWAPTRDRIARPKLGRAKNNVLDPIIPIPGFSRVTATLTLDADSHMLPIVLRALLGAPSTTGPVSTIYTHTWLSGVKTPQYGAIQFKFTGDVDDTPARIFVGLVLDSISVQASGEQTRNFDVVIQMRGLTRTRAAAFLGSTPSALAAESPMSRALFLIDGSAASDALSASWSWNRNLVEDLFLSSTPTISGLRPGESAHAGAAKFRALGAVFDDMEEADTAFAAKIQMVGVTSTHEISLTHNLAMLAAPPLNIPGPGLIERDIAWVGYQDASNPAASIVVKNGVVSYP